MKCIIWIATDRKHRIIGMWWSGCVQPLSQWKKNVKFINGYYITKHHVWL